MSLTALAVRLATVRALRGRTLAGERVYDSKISPVHIVALAESKPTIVVTTDDDDNDITGKELGAGDHSLELVIEFALTEKVTLPDKDGGGEILTIPATDAGLEATLDIIGWQVGKALALDGGPWGDLWRMLVPSVKRITTRRGADDEGGARYAARQLVLILDHIAEPTPHVLSIQSSAWARVLAAMQDDPDTAALAKIIEGQVASGDYLPWEAMRGLLGLPNDAAEIVGIKPVQIDEMVPLAAVDMTDGRTLDQATVEAADGPEAGR